LTLIRELYIPFPIFGHMKPDMFRLLLIFSLILGACTVNTQKRPGDIVLPYPVANDSFLVHITDLSGNAKAGDTIHFVYYPDESLKSGKHIEELIEVNTAQLQGKHFVFVGMAHYGQFRAKRRRDFIAPSVKTDKGYIGVSATYGQADTFFTFLKGTIIPLAETKYKSHPVQRSFIGHSLGGLFATYLFIHDDSLFHDLYALSPALWIDNYQILKKESEDKNRIMTYNKNIWISCGGNETINRIRRSVANIEDSLGKRNYPGIHYSVKIYDGENHNSSVMPAMKEIFSIWMR
jgi:predicted alpha/beta superfamily hydrolase